MSFRWFIYYSGMCGGCAAFVGWALGRMLRSEEARIRFRPHRFWALVSDFTAPIARVVPSLAYHLIATKDVGR